MQPAMQEHISRLCRRRWVEKANVTYEHRMLLLGDCMDGFDVHGRDLEWQDEMCVLIAGLWYKNAGKPCKFEGFSILREFYLNFDDLIKLFELFD